MSRAKGLPNAELVARRAQANYTAAIGADHPDDRRARRCREVIETAALAKRWGIDIPAAAVPELLAALKREGAVARPGSRVFFAGRRGIE